MARYTCSFTIAVPIARLRQLLVEVLQSCNLEMIHATNDFMMAREIPGQVSFAKLVTVEALIDKTTTTNTETSINLVIKNEELPLQVDNHCHQIFEVVKQAILENRDWQLVESVA
ncbi:MAG: hypothetical protein KME05_19290 [Gloeocapsa sp. UFS-A4-WI-NPMV-4B04]|jgi:hypothetical protein|nr:hypothetical protein [Gloeocapsa sp. UFS-A4-WI-NPMV-4B04]